jgi:hypothetical protein
MATTILKDDISIRRITAPDLVFPIITTIRQTDGYLIRQTGSIYLFDGTESEVITEYIPVGTAVQTWSSFVVLPNGTTTGKLYCFQSIDGTDDNLVQVKDIPAQSDSDVATLRDILGAVVELPYIKFKVKFSSAISFKWGLVLYST